MEVANVPPGARIREKPVRAVPAAGLSPMSPASNENEKDFYETKDKGALIAEEGTVETPDLASIAKLPELRKFTAAGPRAAAALVMI